MHMIPKTQHGLIFLIWPQSCVVHWCSLLLPAFENSELCLPYTQMVERIFLKDNKNRFGKLNLIKNIRIII